MADNFGIVGMHTVNTQTLETVKDILSAELDEASVQCEQLSAPDQSVDSDTLAKQFSQLRGTFSLLSMTGAEMLAGELSVVLASWSRVVEEFPAAAEQVANAASLLTNYFSHVLQSGVDTSLLLAPEINDLRKLTGQLLLDDSDFQQSLLPEAPIVFAVVPKTPSQHQILKRAHQLFQKGLLQTLKGQSRAMALRVMMHATTLVTKTLADTHEQLHWQLVTAVLRAMALGQLSLSKQRLRTLMGVERQIAALMKVDSNLLKCYPPVLQKGLLTCLMLSDGSSDEENRLGCRLEIDLTLISDHQIKTDRALLNASSDTNFPDTLASLEGYLADLRVLLDDAASLSDRMESETELLRSLLLSVADVCTVLGLTLAETRFSQHGKDGQLTSELNLPFIQDMADSVLYLDCVLLQMDGKAPNEKQLAVINQKSLEATIEENMVLHAEKLVLQESVLVLAEIMRAISDYCDGREDSQALSDQVRKFDVVSGSAHMLQLPRAAVIAERCKELFTRDLGRADVSLEAIADAIVSLEFYLENRSRSQQADESVLEIAEDCLKLLDVSGRGRKGADFAKRIFINEPSARG